MKIGIDIDNVISNFDEILKKEFLIYDRTLRNTGIINEKLYITEGMFDWTEEELKTFYSKNIERIAKKLTLITDSKKYIDMLKDDGHLIYIITGRDNGEYSNPIKMTKEWLAKNNIYYDKLIFTDSRDKNSKARVCVENNIDIMIDDSSEICKRCLNNGITTLLMDKPSNRDIDITRVNSWRDIYNYLSNYKENRLNVILDTDTYNECYDQFALTYMLKSQDKFKINAITIAPFSHSNPNVIARESQNLSYNEVLKICNWLNFETSNRVFRGSTDYISNGYDEDNEAVNKIIEFALKNKKTYIMVIGAITNVALAIRKEPRIIDKIEIIWLGGNAKNYNNDEYNFRQDIEAVKIVFATKVKLTIIPCEGVASNLMISLKELRKHLNNENIVSNYLLERFYNDGYHEIQDKRVIWDISVIAYLINRKWFDVKEIDCPIIDNDLNYIYIKNDRKVKFVTSLNSNNIYNDLFRKLGE